MIKVVEIPEFTTTTLKWTQVLALQAQRQKGRIEGVKI